MEAGLEAARVDAVDECQGALRVAPGEDDAAEAQARGERETFVGRPQQAAGGVVHNPSQGCLGGGEITEPNRLLGAEQGGVAGVGRVFVLGHQPPGEFDDGGGIGRRGRVFGLGGGDDFLVQIRGGLAAGGARLLPEGPAAIARGGEDDDEHNRLAVLVPPPAQGFDILFFSGADRHAGLLVSGLGGIL